MRVSDIKDQARAFLDYDKKREGERSTPWYRYCLWSSSKSLSYKDRCEIWWAVCDISLVREDNNERD
jgi:hypothetical protein